MSLLKLFCPVARVDSVLDVPVAWISSRGFRGVVLDVDNTIVPWNTDDLSPEIAQWVESLKRAGLSVCIVSNSGGVRRVEELAKRLGIDCVTLAVKPSKRAFRMALEKMNVTPSETIGIGDQMFTDVLGGNRMGLSTVLVRPMVKRDFILTKFVRLVERVMLKVLEKRGMMVSRLEYPNDE